MTFAQFAEYIRTKTKTDTSSFTNEEMLIYANVFKDEIAQAIVLADENYFGFVHKANLNESQRDYPLPDEVMASINRVEVDLDGNGYKKIEEFNLNLYDNPTAEEDIQREFAAIDPKYLLYGGSLYIYSGSAIEAREEGIKLWSIVFPADFTDLSSTNDMSVSSSDSEHGFPREFHELLSRRVIIAYKESQTKQIALSEKEKKFDDDLEDKIELVTGQNKDRSVEATFPYDDGSNY